MIKAWDADGHIYESEVTFSEKYWDPKFKDLRPKIVELDPTGKQPMGSRVIMTDGIAWPVRSGPQQMLAGNPFAIDGVPLPSFKAREKLDPLDSSEFRSAAGRIAVMEWESIHMQVNYPSMLLSWPVAHTPGLGAAVARSYNSWMADISSQAPDKLKWVTVIDFSDPKEAAREIYRSKDLGSVGVMVFGIVGNKHITHPDFEPIWEATNDTGLAMAVHPGFSSILGDLYTTTVGTLTVPFVFTVIMGFHSIISDGFLDRYPNMKVGFLETGCQWLPFMMERIEENSPGVTRSTAGTRDAASVLTGYEAELEPLDYIKRGQLFVGFEVNEGLLPAVIDLVGDECLLYASDIPHGHRMIDAGAYLEQRTDISEQSKRALLVDNTARFYNLPVLAEVPSAG